MDATGTVTNALAAGAGGSQAVTLADYAVNVGEFAVVAGNDQPTYITAATTGSGATTAITLNEANKYATAAGAPLTVYKACSRERQPTPRATWKGSVRDGLERCPPQIGQLVAFGTGRGRVTYTVIESYLSDAEPADARRSTWIGRWSGPSPTATSASPARPAH